MIFEDNNSTAQYFGDLTCSQKWTSRRHVTAAPLIVLNCQEVRQPLGSSIVSHRSPRQQRCHWKPLREPENVLESSYASIGE